MGILRAIQDLLMGMKAFRVPSRSKPVSRCSIRLIADEDTARCEEIYLANEVDYFPEGFFDSFRHWLRAKDSLQFIAELDGNVVGVGGISLRDEFWGETAVLEYGMVHPAYARRGVGTALLLVRIAALPKTKLPCKVLMSSAGETVSFYKRFGFVFVTKQWVNNTLLPFYVANVSRHSWQKARSALGTFATVDSNLLDRLVAVIPKRELRPEPLKSAVDV